MLECFIVGRNRRFRRRIISATVLGGTLALSDPAYATYSLLAVDTETAEVGGFAVSCIGTELSLSEVIRLNESGIIAAQGYFFEEGRDEIARQLQEGAPPSQAIEAALAESLDPTSTSSGPTYRQYAALDLGGMVAQHSGTDLDEFAGHRSGTVGTVSYAISGNTLTDSGVLDQLEDGFTASGAGLAERAVSALGALADSGGGDSRCSPRSGDAGYFVWRAQGAPILEIEIVEPEQEIALALAAQIRETLPKSDAATPPPEKTQRSGDSTPEGGCSVSGTKGGQGAAAILALLALGARLSRRHASWPAAALARKLGS